jgi:hypothetical protein
LRGSGMNSPLLDLQDDVDPKAIEEMRRDRDRIDNMIERGHQSGKDAIEREALLDWLRRQFG